MKRLIIPGFLALVAASSLAVAWQQHQALLALRDRPAINLSSTTPASYAVSDLEDRLRQLQIENDRLRQDIAERPPAIEEIAADAMDAGGAADGPPGWTSRGGQGGRNAFRERAQEFFSRMASDPAATQLMHLEARRGVDQRYADFLAGLRLPPDQLEAVRSLLASRETARRSLPVSARQAGIDTDDATAMEAFRTQTLQPIDDALRQSLGSNYSQLQAYEQAIPYQGQINNLNTRLTMTGQPLQDYQRGQLASVLAANPTPSAPRRSAPEADWQAYFQGVEQANAQLVNSARSVLSPQQVQALTDIRREELQRQQLRYQVGINIRNMRQQAAGGPPGG